MTKKRREIIDYIGVFSIISIIMFWLNYDGYVNRINSTMFAFSYKYGFISRGFIGTCYQLLDRLFAGSIMTNHYITLFAIMVNAAVVMLFILLTAWIFAHVEEASKRIVVTLAFILLVFLVPTFSTNFNLGRLDIFLIGLDLICCFLIIIEKCEFLIIPLCWIAIMVHQGYAFMYFNVPLVLLFAKILSQKSARRKYISIFAITIIGAAILFFWFELFSHASGDNIYEEIVANANAVSPDGICHIDVIDKEIKGVSLNDREVAYHIMNAFQLPFVLLFFAPYIIICTKIIKAAVKYSSDNNDKLKYIAVGIGAATIIPDLLLKIDYGRWLMAIIFYYLMVFIVMIGMKDAIFIKAIREVFDNLKNRSSLWIILVAYPLLLTPLMDVATNWVVTIPSNYLLNYFGLMP